MHIQWKFGFAVVALSLACMVSTASAAPNNKTPVDKDANAVFRVLKTGELVGTGARRPTDEEWAWGERHMIKTRGVKLNKLGLARVNEARRRKGLAPLGAPLAAPVGAEALGAPQALLLEADTTASEPGALPASVDNSTLKYFPPIRSQGSLGSCAQFSAVYYTLTHMTAMARDWDAKNGGDTYRFSPKWTYNMVNGGANQGTWHYDAYAIAQKHGLATWAEFPYDANYLAWCLNPAVWRNAIKVRAAQTGKVLDVDTDTGLTQLKQLLVDGYVLNFATYISSWQSKAAGNDPATTEDDALAGKSCVYAVNGSSGGHAMTIVGYNDNLWVDINSDGLVTSNEKGALRIANSWGTGWGEAGFCWVAYQALRTRNPAATYEGLFWYDEACWVTARASYSPQLIGEFTINHRKRNQIAMTLGRSEASLNTPSTTWHPNKMLYYAGGAYAFDGTTVARDGTFCFDLTDLMPATSGAKRYYLGMRDSTLADSALVTSFKLVDLVNGREVSSPAVPQYADAQQVYAYVDYDIGSGTVAPVAAASATPVSGDIPLVVTFDGTASHDPDGIITAYNWNFGDGETASGVIVQHTYTRAGTFAATLTVTDDAGASGSYPVSISTVDPSIIAAPSGLTAAASSRTVTLRWTDNAGNETGFSIERATKSKVPFAVVGSAGANAATWSQTVAAGTYYYRVRAVNSTTGHASPYSNTASLRVH